MQPETQFSIRLWKSGENRIVFALRTPAGTVRVTSRTVVVPEPWYHVAVTSIRGRWSSVSMAHWKLKQGLPVGQVESLSPPRAARFVGATHEGKRLLKGKLDEALFYNRALTAAEIQSL